MSFSTRRWVRGSLLAVLWCVLALSVQGQEPPAKSTDPLKKKAPDKEELSVAPAKVDVVPVAHDREIRKRLQSVLVATGWFVEPTVKVEEGVVFLGGQTQTEDLKKWAGDLASKTQDVVAVANSIEVIEPSIWDFGPAWSGLLGLWRDFVHSLPFLMFALLILLLAAGAGVMATRLARRLLRSRIQAKLLRSVVAYAIGFFVLLVGVYIVLRVSGLTQLALTVVGGTGLVGLAVGIAFRDITENFLASVFLSVQRPFASGDLVEIAGITGFIQQLNMRTTVMITVNGNIVQIPNATVYKSTLRNFTTNPNRREDFVVGIGYDDAISEAQDVALKVLLDHPAILRDPEPWVLADSFGTATINLRVYFWINGHTHSVIKVRSSVIRLVKLAFQKQGISMPDEAREVVFPQGIPVTMIEAKPHHEPEPSVPDASDAASTQAEGGLASEAGVIEEQARQAQPMKEQDDLLKDPPSSPPAKG